MKGEQASNFIELGLYDHGRGDQHQHPSHQEPWERQDVSELTFNNRIDGMGGRQCWTGLDSTVRNWYREVWQGNKEYWTGTGWNGRNQASTPCARLRHDA